MKSIYILFAFLLGYSFSFFTFHNGYSLERNSNYSAAVSFTVVGDLMCHTPQIEYARVSADSLDFAPVFQFVKKNLSSADFTLGNLETVLGGKELGYSGYPLFNSPDDYLTGLRKAGFDALFFSNNHSMDQGEKGVLRTLQKMKENGLYSAGANSAQEQQDSSVLILQKYGIKTAWLSFTYGLNGNYVPKGKEYLVNRIDTLEIKRQIALARHKGADIVIAYFHFGEEYKRKPNNFQKMIVNKALEYGADIILGSHPHVLQPYEWKKSSSSVFDSALVVYSMGNFISNQRKRYTDAGIIVNFSIEKNFSTNNFRLTDLSFEPTWVFKGTYEKKRSYLIIPSKEALTDTAYSFLSSGDRKQMLESLRDTEEIMNLDFSIPSASK
ncbi:MAG TPA: CapA family protein [Ignavibacteriales bacterium]|nr:CapA family protein [Ignavibacteriales bacterium]